MIREKLGSVWKYEFYLDEDIVRFFHEHPIDDLPDITQRFNSIQRGEHKADLFRYYYLYVKGGIFIDSDAMIYEDIDSIVKDATFVSVYSSHKPGTLFQGILGASPKNPIIKRALYDAYHTDPNDLVNNYHYWCKQLYTILKEDTSGSRMFRERITWGGDEILDEENRIVFRHFWYTKRIPQKSDK